MNETDPEPDDLLYRRRHSLAHVLAQAVLQVRPRAKLGFGPPIDTGFYYDFLFEEPLGLDDLSDLQKRMAAIVKEKQVFEGWKLPFEEAVKLLEEMDQPFKIDYARDLHQGGEREIGFYRNGPFTDMCQGPHVGRTDEIPAGCFKLDTVSAAYWRGSEANPSLTRIYGLAFADQKQLAEFEKKRELARERDHRKLGQELEIFFLSEQVGKGLPMWLPSGQVITEELERLAKEEEFKAGYQRVATPHIAKDQLYLTSGHLPYYREGMFPPMELGEGEGSFFLKPMNCPHHHLLYACRPRSYRELPLRLAEYGNVYRYEKSGVLAGLLRVRGMAMNDAHIYCTREQVPGEFRAVIELHRKYYEMFRLENFWLRLSLHDSDKEKFVTAEEAWIEAEQLVEQVLIDMGLDYRAQKGEAAFYGPKLDYQLTNVIGREETLSTSQLDFVAAERFDLQYVAEDGKRRRPWVIHRAPLSTHERLVSFLLEHFGGHFPTWMAPVQALLVPVSLEVADYAARIAVEMRSRLIRAEVDDSHDSFNKKVRKGATRKIGNIFILGGREKENESVTWRRWGHKDQQTMPLGQAMAILEKLRSARVMDNFPDVAIPGWGLAVE